MMIIQQGSCYIIHILDLSNRKNQKMLKHYNNWKTENVETLQQINITGNVD